MRLICHLKEIRGKRSLQDIADASGIHRGTLSRIEAGQQLPRDEQIYAIGSSYGAPPTEWYSELGLLAIQEDEAVE
jgi:transcriptional regulator with XRE-family HTH domain